ncbi:hypothetical protein HDV05_006231 [Chytridiales sp. JEL 0842]|nr:hypothetical protein HDV05_006231 [Chytridiales sp. JEL 0842]
MSSSLSSNNLSGPINTNSNNIWDRFIPEIRLHILDLSDALTQYLHNHGAYAIDEIQRETNTKKRQQLYNEIWAAALDMEWEGDLKSLPGWFQPVRVRDWYELIKTKTMYSRLLEIRGHIEPFRQSIPMRHCWYEFLGHPLENQKDYINHQERHIKEAAVGAHLQYMLHLQDLGCFVEEVRWKELALALATEGRLQDIRYLIQHHPNCIDAHTTNAAARSGNLELFDLLYILNRCTDDVMKAVVGTGNVRMLKHLHRDLNLPCYHEAIVDAIRRNDLAALRYFHENFHDTICTSFSVTFSAGENADAFKYLYENCDNVLPTEAMSLAVEYGKTEVLALLDKNGAEGWTTDVMDFACAHGHLEMVKWLHENRNEGCTTGAMDAAARNGYLYIVKWLAGNRVEGCTMRALESARRDGHYDTIEFLEQHPELFKM